MITKTFERIVRYSKLLCLLPPYDFRKKRIVPSFLCALSALLHVILPIAEYIIMIRTIIDAPKYNKDDKIIFWIRIFVSVVTSVTTITGVIQSLYRRPLWNQFFRKLTNLKFNIDIRHLDRNNCIMVSVATIPMLWSIMDYRISPINLYCHFLQSLIVVIFINFLTIVLYKLHELKCATEQVRSSIDVRRLRRCQGIYSEAGEIGEMINCLYGANVLMIFANNLGRLLYFPYRLLQVYLYDENPVPHLMQLVVMTISALVQLLAVCYYCDLVTRETRKTKLICFKLQLESTGDEEELQCLISLLNNNPITFSASGYFVIDRSTMSSLLTIVGTYFVAILQIRNGL